MKAKSGGQRERKGFLARPPEVLLKALASMQAYHERQDAKVGELLKKMLRANPKMGKKTKQSPGYVHQGAENDCLFQTSYQHAQGRDCSGCDTGGMIIRDERGSTAPEIHYGIIASGNTLVKDAVERDRIAADIGEDCICLEMEAAGLMNHFPCLVIRGICDYADSHKNDKWQRYAAATAAACGREFLDYVSHTDLQRTKTVKEALKSPQFFSKR